LGLRLLRSSAIVIQRIEIENFYSIRDAQTIDLAVAANVADEVDRFAPAFPGARARVPKVVAVFGANASGKSTVLKALALLAWFARESFQLAPGAVIPCERFNDEESLVRPIRLALEFGGPSDLTAAIGDQAQYGAYRYELEIQLEHGAPRRVAREALRFRPSGIGKWHRVFERAKGGEVKAGKSFALPGYANVIDKVRSNASLVSTLAQFDHGPSLYLRQAAATIYTNILVDRVEPSDIDTVRWYAENPGMLAALNRELDRIDLGIRAMRIEAGPNGPSVLFDHHGLAAPMHWVRESHGTRSFIRCFPMIVLALETGGVALVDELDTSIHPLVLPELLRWFHDPARNRLGAQLWATCHHASLLEDLAKEEILFCEKDDRGRTSVYGLQDVQAVRRTDNRYRKYLSGVYGAIPRIG